MLRDFWRDRRVLLTGGHGFLGSFLREQLDRLAPASVIAPRRSEVDLRDAQAVRALLAAAQPNVIIHAAASIGGIGANRAHPGAFFYDNAVMGIHLIEEARRANVEKFVCIGTVCAYPKFTPTPFREEDIWNGYPEETNAPYGLAKKMLLVQLQAYRAEYGFNGIFLLPANLYGPRDDFDPATSHVIPALIRRFLDAVETNTREVVVWGDGSPTREFLYVADAAGGILLATERYDGAEPMNLGTSDEVSIRTLTEMIAAETGFQGTIRWDTSQPNGQPRRRLDVTRASALGFRAGVSLRDGLRTTIDWYRAMR